MATRSTLSAPSQPDGGLSILQHDVAAHRKTEEITPYLVAPYLPDEALISIVGRIHVLNGNNTTSSTYRELFHCSPFNLTAWIPPHVEVLAQRLGADVARHTAEILRSSTLYPLLETFNGISTASRSANSKFARTTRRSTMQPVRLCLQCLREDIETFGVRYIHRSHQVPGVEVCSKHGIALLYKCPFCECLIGRRNELVLTPWRRCGACKRYIFDSLEEPAQSADPFGLSYARFTDELLSAPPMTVRPSELVECYRRRAREIGFGWGSDNVRRTSLMPEIEEFYGKAFLSRVDVAYREERLTDWFKMLSTSSATEPPLGRHLLFAHFLFREATSFLDTLRLCVDEGGVDLTSKPTRTNKGTAVSKAESTVKPTPKQRATDFIRHLLDSARGIPQCSVEDLWRSNYGIMKRLVTLDPDAINELRRKLKNLKPKLTDSAREPTMSPKDQEIAQRIRKEAESLYLSVEKPEKVTVNRLIRDIGWNPYVPGPFTFPQAKRLLDESTETNWYFYARRIVWSKLYYKHASDTVVRQNSGIEYHRSLVLMTFFQDIDLSTPLRPTTVTDVLKDRGIHRDWIGPCPERDFPPAGRRFYK